MENNSPDYLNILGQVDLDEVYIQFAFDYYLKRYQASKIAQSFMNSTGLISKKRNKLVKFGFCDRTLGRYIRSARDFEGAAIRGSLQRVGLIRPTGHELFRGCVIVPEFNDNKQIVKATGYRYQRRIRPWDVPIIIWKKPEPQAYIDKGMEAVRQLIYG